MSFQHLPKKIPRSLRIEALLLDNQEECSSHPSERKSRHHNSNRLHEEVIDNSERDDTYFCEDFGEEAEEYDPGQDKSLEEHLEENHRTRSNKTTQLIDNKSSADEQLDKHIGQYRCKCFVKFAEGLGDGSPAEDESLDDLEDQYHTRFASHPKEESSDQEYYQILHYRE